MLIIGQRNNIPGIYAVWPVGKWGTTGAGRMMAFPPSYPACVRLFSSGSHVSGPTFSLDLMSALMLPLSSAFFDLEKNRWRTGRGSVGIAAIRQPCRPNALCSQRSVPSYSALRNAHLITGSKFGLQRPRVAFSLPYVD